MTAEDQFMALVKAQGGDCAGDLAEILLHRAREDILGLCNVWEMPEETQATQAELALIYFNRIGAEGEQKRTEGDITYQLTPGVPENIKRRLLRYNKGRVV